MEDEKLYREVEDYIQSLNKIDKDYLIYHFELNEYFNYNNLDNFTREIIRRLNQDTTNDKNKSNPKEIISSIKGLLFNCINPSDIDFMSKSNTAITFCYLHLMNNDVFNKSGDFIFFNKRRSMKEKTLKFFDYSRSEEMKNFATMKTDFINFINHIQCQYKHKHDYLLYLNKEYSKSIDRLNTSWIKANNKSQIEWIHKYITKPASKRGEKNEFDEHISNRPKIFKTGEYGTIFLPAMLYALPGREHTLFNL